VAGYKFQHDCPLHYQTIFSLPFRARIALPDDVVPRRYLRNAHGMPFDQFAKSPHYELDHNLSIVIAESLIAQS